MKKPVIAIRFEPAILEQLKKLAKTNKSSVNALVNEAVADYFKFEIPVKPEPA